MNIVALIALLLWPILAIGLAAWLRVPRAVVLCCLAAWMFLPEGGMDFPGPLDLSKINVTNLSLLLGVAIFEPRRLMALRPSLADLPIAILCVSSLFSSLTNGLGLYDGIAESIAKTLVWGVPWVVGRACFTSLADLRVLVIGIVLGGLAYLPLCLYEIRMSPQLHRLLYGYFPHAEFAQTRRFGGFRPNVFMQHGLMVGLWMCLSALAGAWLWRAGRVRAVLGVPMWLAVPAQAAVAVLCKSAGAVLVAAGGWGVLLASGWMRTRLLLLALAIVPTLYVGYRVAGGPVGPLVSAVAQTPLVGERSDSLEYRIEAEQVLLGHAMERPLFGWGGYGRHRPRNDAGEELARTDSLWIITFGQNGVLGLVSLYVALALPLWTVARRLSPAAFLAPRAAPLLILALLTTLFACDSLFNAMIGPIYILAAGAVLGTVQALGSRHPLRRSSAQRPRRHRPATATSTPSELEAPPSRASPPAVPAHEGGDVPTPTRPDPAPALVPAGRAPARSLDSLGLGLLRFKSARPAAGAGTQPLPHERS